MIEPRDEIQVEAGDRPGRRPFLARLSGLIRPRSRWDLLAVVPVALAVFGLVSVVEPLTFGPLSLLLVLEEQAFVVVVAVLLPVALLTRAKVLGLGLMVAALAGGFLFGSQWVSLPGSGGDRSDFSAMTWNLQYGIRTPAETVAQLQNVTQDVVALLELEPDATRAVQNDPALLVRYPYRLMAPMKGAWGTGILSRYPISQPTADFPPSRLSVLIATPRGPVRLIVAHPNHADIRVVTPLRIPVGYDSLDRDTEIGVVRQMVDASIAAGERLLILGDFNTTPTEPEFKVLTRGLRDTQVEVGIGPGWTWRPSRFAFLPFGFLRIDLQLTAGPIRPTSTSMDCSLPGDHCRLVGTYEID